MKKNKKKLIELVNQLSEENLQKLLLFLKYIGKIDKQKYSPEYIAINALSLNIRNFESFLDSLI